MKVLSIETSCDDTSVAILSFDGDQINVLDMKNYSQIDFHKEYGGVVPEVASRMHSDKIISILNTLGKDYISDVDKIYVTSNPGLPGSLIVGKSAAYAISSFFDIDVSNINHINGHIFSLFLNENLNSFSFPIVVLTASGGHNDLYLLNGDFKSGINIIKLGSTLDDAAGECYDKVSKMLGGPYPGGPWICENAVLGKPNAKFKFKRVYIDSGDYDFSFSGMKSQIFHLLEFLNKKGISITNEIMYDICYEFQEAMIEILGNKLLNAGNKYNANTIAIAGGVSANKGLMDFLSYYGSDQFDVIKPQNIQYCMDNAAMIGASGIIEDKFKINY